MRRSQAAPRLLRQVRGRQHANDEDHVLENERQSIKGPSTQQAESAVQARNEQRGTNRVEDDKDEEDFDREPESSGDEQEQITSTPNTEADLPTKPASAPGSGFRKFGGRSDNRKRSSSQEDNDDHDDHDEEIFGSSQGSPKRRKFGNGSFSNLLAPQAAGRRVGPQKYGRNATAAKPAAKGNKFRQSIKAANVTEKPAVVTPFKKLRSQIDQHATRAAASDDVEAHVVESYEDDEDEVENSSMLEQQCPMCGESIGPLVLEEFEDAHRDQLRGRRMDFRWQKRFCHHHRVTAARATWQERGYPDIDWATLDERMRKHDAFLLRVLEGTSTPPSYYRAEMRARLKPGSKGIQQSFNSGKPGASVGYYGPRGEKAMTDYVLNHLSAQIRQRAAQDDLVARSGVSGGVSGFVQAVLVPHLAELLIKDDMDLDSSGGNDWAQKARRVIADSADLGDLLYPEAEDRVELVSDDDEEDQEETG